MSSGFKFLKEENYLNEMFSYYNYSFISDPFICEISQTQIDNDK